MFIGCHAFYESMSILFILLGQCGNQIGNEFANTICQVLSQLKQKIALGDQNGKFRHLYNLIADKFFFSNVIGNLDLKCLKIKSISIDTEWKTQVKNGCGRYKSNDAVYWYRDDEHILVKSNNGCSNNWAVGYKINGPNIMNQLMNKIRRIHEELGTSLDVSIIICMSMSGGTGSGIGSLLNERIRETYPKIFLMNHIIFPHSCGDITVQSYNCLFSLSKIYYLSDFILVSKNDNLLQLSWRLNDTMSFIPNDKNKSNQVSHSNRLDLSFRQINQTISSQLASLLIPYYKFDTKFIYQSLPLADIRESLQTYSHKFTSCYMSPLISKDAKIFENPTWLSLLNDISHQTSDYFCPFKKKLLLYMYGTNLANEKVTKELFNSNSNKYKLFIQSKPQFRYSFYNPMPLIDKSMTCLTNFDADLISRFDDTISQAWQLYNSKFYIHHYFRYGIECEDFVQMFVQNEDILHKYQKIVH
ncbi:Delta-tubulin [Intoshia linei]|uniref:Tubulin delta chain n=1 Tax=Intoshia linei TaxID=1819745 RepID=A0A177B027_9BILA|nr:Delta-tubulin [Intoshia linei]